MEVFVEEGEGKEGEEVRKYEMDARRRSGVEEEVIQVTPGMRRCGIEKLLRGEGWYSVPYQGIITTWLFGSRVC